MLRVYGGYAENRNAYGQGTATGNTITITGGTIGTGYGNGQVYGGHTSSDRATTGNTINLGDGANAMKADTDLTNASFYGGSNTSDVTGNTLNVNASGIIAKRAQNFEKYNFNLTKGVTVGTTVATIESNTMLKLTESSALGNTQVQWKNITLNAEKWNDDKMRYGKAGTVQMLWGNSGAALKVYHDAAMDRKATSGDFEYHMYADVTHKPIMGGYNLLNYIRADVNRFRNADATADNVTGTEVYGGYSSLGNTTTNNRLKITNTNNTSLNVYGGYTAGAGDSTNNHVTIASPSNVMSANGGYATAANGKAEDNSVTVEKGGQVGLLSYAGWAKGAVSRNVFTVRGRANGIVYGGWLQGSGTADGNEVRVDGGTVKFAFGALGKTDATVTGNKVTVTNGTVEESAVAGSVSGASGKAIGNIASITDSTIEGSVYGGFVDEDATASANKVALAGSTVKKNVYGGYDSRNGTVEKNEVTISNSVVEKSVFGGCSKQFGTVTDNRVAISGGTFGAGVYGGYAAKSGVVTGNKVTLTGGMFQEAVYGGAGGDNSAAGKTFDASGNTVTVTAARSARIFTALTRGRRTARRRGTRSILARMMEHIRRRSRRATSTVATKRRRATRSISVRRTSRRSLSTTSRTTSST